MPVTLRTRTLLNGDTSFFLDVVSGGHRHAEFIKDLRAPKRDKHAAKEAWALAEQFLRRRQLELAMQTNSLIDPKRQQGNFVDYFERLATSKKGSALHVYAAAAKYLRDFTSGNAPFHLLTASWLESLSAYMEKHLSSTSASVYISVVKAGLKKARRDKLLSETFEGAKTARPTLKQVVALSIDELRRLNEAPCRNAEVKQAFLFASFTGLRLGDVRMLSPASIIEEQGAMCVQLREQKTGKLSTKPLSREAVKIVQGQLNSDGGAQASSGKLFYLPASNETLSRELIKWTEAAGIKKKITFHVSRKTFSQLVRQTSGIYQASKLLSHSSVAVTERHYASLPSAESVEAVGKLPLLSE